ncbi:MAG TPA: aspartate carbamoyltransferase [Candidatus Saccharimonadia bacterium]
MKHVLNVEQFTPEDLTRLFKEADIMREHVADPAKSLELARKHHGKQICTLFYEPSTRTRFSFESGALKLGMGVVSTENAGEFSSASKGETITDTMQMLNGYQFAAVVIRHPQTGIVATAAEASDAPIINAGDGKGDHPTQSLLDLYTIHRHFRRLENLRIVMGGDLQNGRTVRSLAKLLSKYSGNHITFVSLPQLQMDDDVKAVLDASGTTFNELHAIDDAFADADVVYWTRLQAERLDPANVLANGGFTLNAAVLTGLPEKAIIMHPLPRVDEIAVEVDADPRAKYFEQAANGLYVRMALLDHLV